jgi:hypothetical protein
VCTEAAGNLVYQRKANMHSSLQFDKEMEEYNNLTIPEEQLDEANDKLGLGVSTR